MHVTTIDATALPVPAAEDIALEARGLRKRFPGVLALDDVSFSVRRGEIHALLGENGAGKSTLIKIVTGAVPPDAGEVLVDGSAAALHTPHDARAKGISLVPQDVLVVPELSIGRNMLLGLEGPVTRRGRLSPAERRTVRSALDKLEATFGEDTPAGRLSVPELRLAQIAKTLIRPGHVLVLDEPTAVLSESDAGHLLQRLRAFRDDGSAIVYVSHRLSEVLQIADRVTVLRDGRCAGTLLRHELDKDVIVSLMAKPDAAARPPGPARARGRGGGAPVLAVRGLTSAGRFSGVTFDVRPGEIVGIAGVQGSGHGHLLKALAGAAPLEGGTVSLDGRQILPGSLRRAYGEGILLVPADRRNAALVGTHSVRQNIVLTRRVRRAVRRLGLRRPARERQVAQEYVDAFSIRTPGTETAAGTLSGGNQQKVALARALEGGPRVLLVEEPTQGIDVNAKREIRALLERLVEDGTRAVVVATSEFEELLGLADTINVMCLGRLTATLDGDRASYRDILTHALP
jgi:ABC-type sugar transport system ATPase subunit